MTQVAAFAPISFPAMATCPGIDIAKDRLDVALREVAFPPDGSSEEPETVRSETFRVGSTLEGGIGTSDGLERPVVAALGAADLPIVVVNSIQTSGFTKSFGRLVQTDQIDAKMLALFGE